MIPFFVRVAVFLAIMGIKPLVLEAQTCPINGLVCIQSDLGNITPADIPAYSLAKIKADFYFVRSAGYNFHCYPNGLAEHYAPNRVSQILTSANACFSDPAQNAFGTSPDLPDSRVRYIPAGDPSQPCSYIYLVDNIPIIGNLPTDIFHIIVFDNDSINNHTMTVTNCAFDSCNTAIHAQYRMPNLANGSTHIKGCVFSNNAIDIALNASPNNIYPVAITDQNVFVGTLSNQTASVGIRINGESFYQIRQLDSFTNRRAPIIVNSTGPRGNVISCNTFGEYGLSAIGINYDNSGLSILGNRFFKPAPNAITLAGSTSAKGSIRLAHGSGSQSAGNCFEQRASAIKATIGQTNEFQYYVWNNEMNPLCYRPQNHLSDGGNNNYRIGLSTTQDPCMPGGEIQTFSKIDLAIARTNTATLQTVKNTDPQNTEKQVAHAQAVAFQDKVLTYLLQSAEQISDWNVIDQLLLEEDSPTALRAANLSVASSCCVDFS